MSSKLSVALRFSIRFNAAYSRSRFKVRMLFPDCAMRVRKSRFLIVKGEVIRGVRLGGAGPCTACLYSWLLWFDDRNLFSNDTSPGLSLLVAGILNSVSNFYRTFLAGKNRFADGCIRLVQCCPVQIRPL